MMIFKQQWWRVLWDKGLREVAIIGFVFMVYRISSGSLDHGFDLARENAYHVVNLEKSLGIFFEPDFQAFFMDNAILTRIVDTIYTIFYYPALILFAIWAFTYHRQQYITVRNIFLMSAVIAFTCFALFPVAPPRMLPELGFIDSMAEHGVVQYESGILGQLANPYAAMPSCHFAWTLLIGTAIFHMTGRWWLKIVGIILPLGMLISIVATGNHYFLDAMAGALVIGLSAVMVRLLMIWRKEKASPVMEDMNIV